MKRRNTAVAVVMMTMVMGVLSGCQGTPPDGYNCKTDSGWRTSDVYRSSFGGGTYNDRYSSTGNYRTSLDNGEVPGSNWTTTTAGNGTTISSATGETDGTQSGSADSYMLTASNVRYYSEEELADLTLWELKVARNEIYARHGAIFGESAVQEHFNTRSWYHGTISISAFDDAVFNEYEMTNIRVIQNVETAKAQ